MKLKRGGIIGKGGKSKTIASTTTTKHWYAGRPRVMQHG
jgi:hypothetical protein